MKWSSQRFNAASDQDSSVVDLGLRFHNVDWDRLRSVYGWAASQYQAWARGHFQVDESDEPPTSYEIYTDQVTEFWIDDKHYFGGDFYGSRRAPLVLSLSPGAHSIDLKLVREVRSMGGVGFPTIDVTVEIRPVIAAVKVVGEAAVAPHLVNGRLASEFASITVRNTGSKLLHIIGIHNEAVGTSPTSKYWFSS